MITFVYNIYNTFWIPIYKLISKVGSVDPKIYTKYFVMIESLIWGRKYHVGNDIFRTQRCNQIPVGKDEFY